MGRRRGYESYSSEFKREVLKRTGVKTGSQGSLYIAQHNQLVIADAWPAQSMSILSNIGLKAVRTDDYETAAGSLLSGSSENYYKPYY